MRRKILIHKTMVQATPKIKDCLARIYEILEFTSDEIDATLKELAKIQQIAVSTVFLEVLTPEEIKAINGAAQKSSEEKKAIMEQIAKAHAGDENFKVRMQAEMKKVNDEHIAYLKTRGDDAQKAEIAKIMAEIE